MIQCSYNCIFVVAVVNIFQKHLRSKLVTHRTRAQYLRFDRQRKLFYQLFFCFCFVVLVSLQSCKLAGIITGRLSAPTRLSSHSCLNREKKIKLWQTQTEPSCHVESRQVVAPFEPKKFQHYYNGYRPNKGKSRSIKKAKQNIQMVCLDDIHM